MRESLDLLQKSLENYSANKNLQNHMLELLECLYKDLENERGTTLKLQEQIQNLTKQENFGITSKFTALKAECVALKEKIATLTNENEDLNIQLIGKEAAVKRKDQQVEECKKMFQQKEQKLYNEIQIVQAGCLLDTDRIEIECKRQIDDYNKKFNDNLNTCNILRNELLSVKEQFAEYKRTTNQKIQQLQQSLREKENQCIYTMENSLKNASGDTNAPVNLQKVPTLAAPSKSSKCEDVNRRRKSSLPPLLPVKTTKSNGPTKRRKKLYNPDDLSYFRLPEGDEN